jgi:hypothetical protein
MLFPIILGAQGWTPLGIGEKALKANNRIEDICISTEGTLYAAGTFTDSVSELGGHKYVARWDGTSWQQVGSGSNALNANGTIECLGEDKTGNLYAAGVFKNTTGYYYVAKWDGTTWQEVGTGTNALRANNTIRAMCIDKFGNIYVAGNFTNASGYYYVAKWDGTTWLELGAGSHALNADGEIITLCIDSFNNLLYAAGDFYNGFKTSVAKWDGISWSDVGTASSPFNVASIWALHIDKYANLYAGGVFIDSGKNYIAKWDGIAWVKIGLPYSVNKLLNSVRSITSDENGIIYAAGSFLDTPSRQYVAYWNGAKWLKAGLKNEAFANCTIEVIKVDMAGNIYAAGNFTDSTASCFGNRYVAKYASNAVGLTTAHKDTWAKIYPNPSKDILEVRISNSLIGYGYSVSNLQGEVINRGIFNSNAVNIGISTLAQGMYIFQIDSSEHHFKIVKE